ncbi:MAG: phosphate acyltransferase PlsX [Alphaproteobacteria bacterium]|nr:phosphate acyltransferase PlsX [Alphaproteobacteria bacterium]
MDTALTIALDAMGGDRAPGIVVEGASLVRQRSPNVRFILFGDEKQLRPLVAKDPQLLEHTEIRHTSEVVTNDMKPSMALRNARQSSMRLAINAVQEGEAAGIVSAGNTGALMAMAKFVLKTLTGIDRPAIATFLPSMRGDVVMLDLGANLECNASHLVQFAVMGNIFAKTVLGLPEPVVGLLNVGEEELKGHEDLREAASILREGGLPIKFCGFIEGNDILEGAVDVAVTDGFTGNVALKATEGVSKFYTQVLAEAFRSSLLSRLSYLLARPTLRKVRQRVDPRRYNGAMMLGLNGVVVKSHGGTDALGFANAIGVAIDMVTFGFNDKIIRDFGSLDAGNMSRPKAAAPA